MLLLISVDGLVAPAPGIGSSSSITVEEIRRNQRRVADDVSDDGLQ